MNDLTTNLRQWRKDRNINKPNTKVYVANVIEELLEIYYEDKETIKHIQGNIMCNYFGRDELSEHETIDAIQDIQVFSINEAEQMSYDNKLCNEEVFKEINSRKQDPKQKEEWDLNGANGKWNKDHSQDKDTLYKADFSKCKLEG